MIGSKLKLYRESNNLSQTELAKKLDVTKVSISGYENNKRTPSIDVFFKIIEELELSPDYLLDFENKVAEESEGYGVRLSKDDLRIIKEFKKNPVMYNKILMDSKRNVEMINAVINK